MTSRTTETVVHFASPFTLPGCDGQYPAGDYRVDHDEVDMQGITRVVWLRVGSFIQLPAIGHLGTTIRMVPVDLAKIRAVQQRAHPRP